MMALTDPSAERKYAKYFLFFLFAYFALQVFIRVCSGVPPDKDEIEQILDFRHFRLGYGTQPPLYSWLQSGVFYIFGLNLFSLSLFKNLLLLGTCLSLFYLVRGLMGVLSATAVTASLFLLPQFIWESQRDLTHTVLLTFMVSVTLWSYFELLKKTDRRHYIVLGALIGCGLQSKYNFVLFLLPLICSSLLIREHRLRVWNRNIILSVGVALLCLLPHAIWLFSDLNAATSGTLGKMNAAANASYVQSVLAGLIRIPKATIAFLTPLWLIYLLLGLGQFKKVQPETESVNARFFMALFGSFFAVVLLLTFTGKLSHIKSRWLQPVLFLAPLLFFIVFPFLQQERIVKRIVAVSSFVAIAVLLVLPVRTQVPLVSQSLMPQVAERIRVLRKDRVIQEPDYRLLSDSIKRRFEKVPVLLARDQLTAGNLYLLNPDWTVMLSSEISRKQIKQGPVLLLARTPSEYIQSGQLVKNYYPDSKVIEQGVFIVPDANAAHEEIRFDYAVLSMGNE